MGNCQSVIARTMYTCAEKLRDTVPYGHSTAFHIQAITSSMSLLYTGELKLRVKTKGKDTHLDLI